MQYTVYINQVCHACDEILTYIRDHKLDCSIVDIDNTQEDPPMDLMVYPALVQGKRLIAYGEDICAILKDKCQGS